MEDTEDGQQHRSSSRQVRTGEHAESKPVSFGWVIAMVVVAGIFFAVSYNLFTARSVPPTDTVMEAPAPKQ